MNHHRDAGISLLDLAKKIGVEHKTIKQDIAKLKEPGLLKRIGPAKGGHWEVIEKSTKRSTNAHKFEHKSPQIFVPIPACR